MIGDHIRARKEGRWTHAIDCGDQTVIHVVDDPAVPVTNRVRRSYRPEFVAGAEAVEVVTHRERVYPARQVVARAYSRTRDPSLAAMFKDSASFAEWCKTGRIVDAPRNVAVGVPGLFPAVAEPKVRARPAAAARSPKRSVKAKASTQPAARKKKGAAKPARALAAKGATRKATRPAARGKATVPAAKKARTARAAAPTRGAKRSAARKTVRKPARKARR
jgi:hypothetical protein